MKFLEGDGDTFYIQNTFDPEPVMERAAALRSAGKTTAFGGDAWHIADIDIRVMDMIIKEAGLKWNDTEAVQDLIKKKLLDGSLSKFRVHEGTY